MVVIIDYGCGNVGSVQNMLRVIGAKSVVSSAAADIDRADGLIFPGVGAFDHAMGNLKRLDLVSILQQKVLRERTPILGICLGMQLMSERSQEGSLQGLGWIEGETLKFELGRCGDRLKLPHMGWNTIERLRTDSFLQAPIDGERFYFVHSYHVRCADEKNVLAISQYGIPFAAVVGRENIVAVQFHPEKSHRFGLRLFQNFINHYHVA